ncbi:putative nicotinamide N-methyase [Sphingomonas zeicaulis]|uniref:hypothetical protein n=1 Tax=Sphingomonas zeicaulis TaxID=1632740 RepID=UPI003D1D3EE4
MKMLLPLFAGLAALAACAPSGGTEPAPAPAGAAPTIAFDISSWGKPLVQWELASDGTGFHVESKQGKGGFSHYVLTRRRLDVGAAGYAEIRALLAGAERYAGRELPCKLQITDQAYGKLSWNDASTSFNYGCRSPQADDVLAAIEKANERLKIGAGKGEILGTDEVGAPR